jgi:tRNA-2-methylthio-N6-dimethylallyladenosine synthase
MAGQLESLGFARAEESEAGQASVVVVNTCSIRDHAEQKVYSYLGPYANRKKKGEPVAIVVAGRKERMLGGEGETSCRWGGRWWACRLRGSAGGPEHPHTVPRSGPGHRAPVCQPDRRPPGGRHERQPGPAHVTLLAKRTAETRAHSRLAQVVATEATHIMEDVTQPRRESEICAWVNIIYGCNERCTYCVVPTTRGTGAFEAITCLHLSGWVLISVLAHAEQSRPRESVVREIEELARAGYREVRTVWMACPIKSLC